VPPQRFVPPSPGKAGAFFAPRAERGLFFWRGGSLTWAILDLDDHAQAGQSGIGLYWIDPRTHAGARGNGGTSWLPRTGRERLPPA
jgi:hypothetical protein